MFCKSLFFLLYFFLWPFCCLFFDILILIIPLVSSNFSSYSWFRSPFSSLCHSNSEAQSYISYIVVVSFATILWQMRTFPHSRLIIGFVTRLTRRVPIMEQELSTLLEHPSSPSHFVGFVLLNLYVVSCRLLFVLFFVLFLAIVFSVRFQFKTSDYPFPIFTFYIHMIHYFQQYFSYIIKVRYISGGNQYLEKTKHLPQFVDKFNCDLHISNKSTLILLKW